MSEYEQLTWDKLKGVVDHLKSIMPPPLEIVYLTQEEWNSLCEYKPVQLPDGMPYPAGRHKVQIVTSEERETILKLKAMNNESHPQIR